MGDIIKAITDLVRSGDQSASCCPGKIRDIATDTLLVSDDQICNSGSEKE